MSRRRLILGLVLLIAIAGMYLSWSSDRRRIQRQIESLQELVSKTGPESAIEGLAAARGITGLLASTFDIRADQLGFRTSDRTELMRFVHQYRSGAESIHMRVTTEALNIVPEHRRATQYATFEFVSGGPLSAAEEFYQVQVDWLLEDGQWLIDSIDLIEIIDRSAP